MEFSLANAAQVVRVSYKFQNAQTISGDAVPVGSKVTIAVPGLLGESWQTTVLVWEKAAQSYQKLLRYQGTLAFSAGGEKQSLEATDSPAWAPLISTQHAGLTILRSFDPRTSYTVEMEATPGTAYSGYVDRTFYTSSGDALTDDQIVVFTSGIDGRWVVKLPDQEFDPSQAGEVDSMIVVNLGETQIQDYFLWSITSGAVAPWEP